MRRRSLILVLLLALAAGACGGGDSEEAAAASAAALTEVRIRDLVSTMEVMAMTSEVQSGDWEMMVGMLTKFQDSAIPLVAWFMEPDGFYYTVSAGRAEANLSDRAYFPKVMSGEIVVGDLVVSRSTGRKAMVAVVPVTSGGEVIGALGISVFLAELSAQTASDIGLSSDAVMYAVNSDGAFSLHTDDALITEQADPNDVDAATATSTWLNWSFHVG